MARAADPRQDIPDIQRDIPDHELGGAGWELLVSAGPWDGRWSDGAEGEDDHFLQSKTWLHSDSIDGLVCMLK